MAEALRRVDVAVIAEVKRRSPSKGSINPTISAPVQARSYAEGGAAAISVLTEPEHFGGSSADLRKVRAAVRIPVLKKDFHVDPLQAVEARAIGASAMLLIARALGPGALETMVRAARDAGVEPLIEVRDEAELERALTAGTDMIGVNNRNLETLVIEAGTATRLIPLIPAGIVAVAESGVSQRADVDAVAAAGADAVLVGSAISAAPDPRDAVRRLVGVRRVSRDR